MYLVDLCLCGFCRPQALEGTRNFVLFLSLLSPQVPRMLLPPPQPHHLHNFNATILARGICIPWRFCGDKGVNTWLSYGSNLVHCFYKSHSLLGEIWCLHGEFGGVCVLGRGTSSKLRCLKILGTEAVPIIMQRVEILPSDFVQSLSSPQPDCTALYSTTSNHIAVIPWTHTRLFFRALSLRDFTYLGKASYNLMYARVSVCVCVGGGGVTLAFCGFNECWVQWGKENHEAMKGGLL
jgi:hypothetical protein